MRRNRWTSFPGHCCGGSAAKSRTRSDAVGFRKGHRRAGAFRPDEFPSRKITDCRTAFAIFAGFFWVRSPLCRKLFTLPVYLSQVQSARCSGHGRVHFHRASVGRAIPRHSHVYSRIERRPWKSEPLDGACGGNAVMLGFQEGPPFFPKTRTEVTGTPVRTDLVRLDRADSRRKLGLREDLPTLLVMGGSQGASGINQALIKALPFLQGVPLQVIHLSGARDERLVADNYRRENVPAYIGAFHHQMEEVYSAADLVVA